MPSSQNVDQQEDSSLDRLLREKFTSDFRTGYIDVDGYCLPENYANYADAIEHLEVRDDDVWVCSFPKTGTTWTQEMVWCIANDLDFEAAKVALWQRFPFLDFTPLFDYTTILPREPDLQPPEPLIDSVKYVANLPNPRFIKTHLPYDLLPRQIRSGERKPKILYVARNAKDTCVSYYHHCRLLEGYTGDFDEFCRLFLAGKLCFAPFWKHVSSYRAAQSDNLLFITYEDMKADLESVLRATSSFLDKRLTDGEMETLKEHLSFASMKSNPAVNYEEAVMDVNKRQEITHSEGAFMRSGEVNQYRDAMTSDVIEEFDRLTEESLI